MLTVDEIEALQRQKCARCGEASKDHLHLFGSAEYLCPTVSRFLAAEPDSLDDWVPEFTVWIVRRGSRHPMVIDSIFTHEPSAVKRARLLGNGWKAEKYSHLKAPAGEGR